MCEEIKCILAVLRIQFLTSLDTYGRKKRTTVLKLELHNCPRFGTEIILATQDIVVTVPLHLKAGSCCNFIIIIFSPQIQRHLFEWEAQWQTKYDRIRQVNQLYFWFQSSCIFLWQTQGSLRKVNQGGVIFFPGLYNSQFCQSSQPIYVIQQTGLLFNSYLSCYFLDPSHYTLI